MSALWDASSYDRLSEPQQQWAADVLGRLCDLAPDSTLLEIGCGTGRVTERLLALVPHGSVLAIDASPDMVALARRRLGGRATVWCEDALELELADRVDAIVSTATLHWVGSHDLLWRRLAQALVPGGRLEVQCGGKGNIERVRVAIERVAREIAPELIGFSPWVFADAPETERRLREAGFGEVRCWLEQRPTRPHDVQAFVATSILPAHLARLAPERREPFARAVASAVTPPLDYVRLNVSARRAMVPAPDETNT
jgi:trans-aconitate 2-methyltransferase